MHRRTVLGGLAAQGLLLATAARAQRATVPKIGLLALRTPDTPNWQATLVETLGRLGRTQPALQFEVRIATGIAELPVLARDLVGLEVDVIVTHLTPAALAARDATTKIPIVMAASADPVAMGLVQSLARPGGNITGMSGANAENTAKTIQILRECLPAMTRLAVLANESDPYSRVFVHQSATACDALGLEARVYWPKGTNDFERVLSDVSSNKIEAVILQPSLPRREAAAAALSRKLPMACAIASFASEGGLLSYAPNSEAIWRRAASFVDSILKGAAPAELPVEQPTQFELVVNLSTARLLQIELPQVVLARVHATVE